MKALTSCEIASKKILPSIRAAIAHVLIERGFTEYRVSKLLGITPAAVSQYKSRKRGFLFKEKILNDPEYRARIEYIADLVLEDNGKGVLDYKINQEVCKLCQKIKKKEELE